MKRLAVYALLIPVFFILANAFSPQAEAQSNYDRHNQDRVCFYADENFRGDSFCAKLGENSRNIGSRYNDRISSIRIPPGFRVTIYDDENFGGRSQTYTQDVTNLGNWNDRFSSFKISGNSRGGGWNRDSHDAGYNRDQRDGNTPRNGACFYTDENFGGRSFCLERGQSEGNLGGHFNDRISSIRIFGRSSVTVFSDENYRGHSRLFSSDIPNLRNMNDQISSIQVR